MKNEKIDIVRWSPDPVEYIVNAISPARVVSVDIMTDDDETKDALVVVPDDQLSLAIGREGQNVRLAHRLTGWKIDIKSVSQMENEEAGANSGEGTSNYNYDDEPEEESAIDSEEIQEEIEEEMNQQAYDEEDLQAEETAEETAEEE